MTEPWDQLTTDPPRPPGTPNVDDLVGDPLPAQEQGARNESAEDDVDDDPVAVEPPD
ncbi:MAG: hypothetical protein QOK35_1710 [Pseudonocardiales bacterium]|nr:hypothetical protein [Pseudonocardiales bacterium]